MTRGSNSPLSSVLTVQSMREAERFSGIAPENLMETAGSAIAAAIQKTIPPRKTVVLCGSGNNGGDGYVVARLLHNAGWDITVAQLAPPTSPTAKAMSIALPPGISCVSIHDCTVTLYGLVIDALFGTGLSRPIETQIGEILTRINQAHLPVFAIDMPSGIQGDTGAIMGHALQATMTLVVQAYKPGHLLFPGHHYAGHLKTIDIGIASYCQNTAIIQNTPILWHDDLPKHTFDKHKYTLGHVLVVGGNKPMIGASLLAAKAAQRTASGIVSIASRKLAFDAYRGHLQSILLREIQNPQSLADVLQERHTSCAIIGPGTGVDYFTKEATLVLLKQRIPCVLDADVFSAFQDDPKKLLQSIQSEDVVMTPHMGEFQRFFGDLSPLSKIECLQKVATSSLATIVLKGADTLIAHPSGQQLVIHTTDAYTLSTAGSGDVLSGIIGSLLSGGMHAFEAACAGVWIQTNCALRLRRPLVPEDLIRVLPQVMHELQSFPKDFFHMSPYFYPSDEL